LSEPGSLLVDGFDNRWIPAGFQGAFSAVEYSFHSDRSMIHTHEPIHIVGFFSGSLLTSIGLLHRLVSSSFHILCILFSL